MWKSIHPVHSSDYMSYIIIYSNGNFRVLVEGEGLNHNFHKTITKKKKITIIMTQIQIICF
jgi:hypothetical protein